MPAEGGEEKAKAIQITQNGGYYPHASSNGDSLYYWKNRGELWRRSVEGGEEKRIGERPGGALSIRGHEVPYWRVFVKDRLYYGKNEEGGGFSIHYLDLKTRTETEVFPQEGPVEMRSLGVALDESWIYYSSISTLSGSPSDIMLMENFH